MDQHVLYYYRSIDGSAIFVGLNLYRLNKIVPMDESSDLKKKQSSIIRDREKVETFPPKSSQACRFDWTNWTNSTKHLANRPSYDERKQRKQSPGHRIFPPWTSRRTASEVAVFLKNTPESTNGWRSKMMDIRQVGGFLALNMAIFVQKKTPIKCPHKLKDILLQDYKRLPRFFS